MKLLFTLIIILLLLAFCAVYAQDATTQATPEYQKEQKMVVSIEVRAGDEFAITLESNRTTGYLWQIAQDIDKTVIELIKSEYIPNDTKLIGSGGKEIWTFKAIKPGKTTIFFQYVRPWEKDVPPAKEKTFSIVVH